MEWSPEAQLDNNKGEQLSKRQTAHVTFYSGIPAHLSVGICVYIIIEEFFFFFPTLIINIFKF